MATFYTGGDQNTYNAGYRFIPPQQYLQNPFFIPPTNTQDPVVNQGIVATNAFNNSGGGFSGYAGNPTDLSQNFMTATQNRTNQLANPNMIQDLFNRYTGGGQRTYNQMIASGQGDIRKSSGIPFGVGSLLSRILPDRYYDMSLGDQAFTQSQMGYTGPTVFGQNTGNQDPFGMNVRSAFGNYGEAVQKNFASLRKNLSGRLADKYGAEFNEKTGMYTGENADRANQQTKMMRDQFNFRKDQSDKLESISTLSKDAIKQKEKDAKTIRDNKQYFSGTQTLKNKPVGRKDSYR